MTQSAYYFDAEAAQNAVDFFRTILVHVKGEKAGDPFVLDPWQEEQIIRPLFGWKRTVDETRRYRTVYIEIPRKNGKSSLGAGLALYLLCADGEAGAEVYSAASDREQAAIIFEVAKQMRARSPELRSRVKPFKTSLVYHNTASTYKVISADAETKHGFNAHGILFDELHAQPNRKLYDVLTTSTGARRQPLTIFLTTAGYDRHSICWEVHEYAQQVRDGILDDPSFLPVIYSVDKDAAWDDPAVWAEANPGLGSSVKYEYLEEQAAKARASLAYQNTFRRLHLNQWTEQAERAIDMERWDACDETVALEDLRGRRAYGGLDLATTRDIAALVLDVPIDGRHVLIPRFWIPRENIANPQLKRDPRIRERIAEWVARGYIIATPGDQIDNDLIRQEINALGEQFNIVEIGYDRWGAPDLQTRLTADGFTMVPIGQGISGMAAGTKEFLDLVQGRRLAHGGNPVLRWMAANLSTKQDADGNLKPDKKSSAEKIDGIVAGIMAVDRACRHADAASVYDVRGVVAL
jgi:phage terminase large subunit-like protein